MLVTLDELQPDSLHMARDLNLGPSQQEAGKLPSRPGSFKRAIVMIVIISSLLRQANTYLPLCELLHVFSDTGGWFLCDRQNGTLRHC